MKTTDPRYILAASYRRLAKTLRVRATNYNRLARECRKRSDIEDAIYWQLRFKVSNDLAQEFDNEARTLRAGQNKCLTIANGSLNITA